MLQAIIAWLSRLFAASATATTAATTTDVTTTAATDTPPEPPAADDPVVNEQPEDDIDLDDLDDTDPIELDEGGDFPQPPADWGSEEDDDWDDPDVIITADDAELAGER